jgi:hypothetical protein
VLAAGVLAPAAASAAPVTLRYDFTASITSTSYHHICQDSPGTCADFEALGLPTTYQGPQLGTAGMGWLTVAFDPDNYDVGFTYSILGLPLFTYTGLRTFSGYDPVSKALSLLALTFGQTDQFRIMFTPDTGSGSGDLGWEQDGSGADFAQVGFRLYDVTVTDLAAPPPAPVPLPATLPLLGAGVAGLGWVRRRAARRA